MSYDVSFQIDTGGEELHQISSHNHTYNCGQMFCKALGGEGIKDLHEQKARRVITRLENAIDVMESDPVFFKKMNPPNGWGSYETALLFLKNILADCRRHPNALIHVS